MSAVNVEAAYRALCTTLGDERGWEQIEPARKLIPASITRKERELDEATTALDVAADLHEQAGTDTTREALGDAAERVKTIAGELDLLREMFWLHPERFEEA